MKKTVTLELCGKTMKTIDELKDALDLKDIGAVLRRGLALLSYAHDLADKDAIVSIDGIYISLKDT